MFKLTEKEKEEILNLKVPEEIIAMKKIEPRTKVFYVFLTYLSGDLGFCDLSDKNLAKLMKTSTYGVRTMLFQLQKANLIKIIKQTYGIYKDRRIFPKKYYEKIKEYYEDEKLWP